MKKLSVLLVALAVAVSASAGVNLKATHPLKSNKGVNMEKLTKDQKQSMKTVKTLRTPSVKDEPVGETKYYLRSGDAIYRSSNGISYGTQNNRLEVVYGENGAVYFKNLLFGSGASYGDNWVEGYLNEDGNIVVPLGQSIYWSDDYQADVVLAWGSSYVYSNDEGTYLGFTKDEEVNEVVYTLDGEIMRGPVGVGPVEDPNNQYWRFEVTGLGTQWTDDESFGGFMEWETVLTETEPFVAPTLITEQPEGELVVYMRDGATIYSSLFGVSASLTDGKLNVVYGENDKVYIQDPLYYVGAGTWVEGTFDRATGIITIPTGQFVYWDDENEYGIQVVWGSMVADEEGNLTYAIDERTTEIQYLVDGDNLYLVGAEGDYTAEYPYYYNCTGLLGIWSDDQSFVTIEYPDPDGIIGRILNVVPAVPADPTINSWYDSGAENGYTYLSFTLPKVDVDGNPMDVELLSYSIYTDDDQIFTFDAATYSYDLMEDMTEIPYWIYSDAYDFSASTVYFYRTNRGDNPMFDQRIGIQVQYSVDGVTNSSNIVYLDVPKATPAVPANPTDLTWSDCGDESGFSRFGFTLPTTDVDGNPIDRFYLSYSIYTDNDQIFTFDAATYSSDLVEDMTEIPYEIFSSGYDFYTGAVYFYRTNEGENGEEPFFNHQIGIQVFYTVNGERNASDIVYLEVYPDTKVNELNADKTIANVRYFNMAGQEMAQPEGMTIKVTTYTDGTTSASKVVK